MTTSLFYCYPETYIQRRMLAHGVLLERSTVRRKAVILRASAAAQVGQVQ